MPVPQTPQSQAIEVANNLLAYAQEVMTLYANLKLMDAQWTDDQVAGTLLNLNTVPYNLDGSLGTTNDPAPDQTHPINTANYPTLNRPVSVYHLTVAKTVLDGIVTYIEGGAVTQQPSARSFLNSVIGG